MIDAEIDASLALHDVIGNEETKINRPSSKDNDLHSGRKSSDYVAIQI